MLVIAKIQNAALQDGLPTQTDSAIWDGGLRKFLCTVRIPAKCRTHEGLNAPRLLSRLVPRRRDPPTPRTRTQAKLFCHSENLDRPTSARKTSTRDRSTTEINQFQSAKVMSITMVEGTEAKEPVVTKPLGMRKNGAFRPLNFLRQTTCANERPRQAMACAKESFPSNLRLDII